MHKEKYEDDLLKLHRESAMLRPEFYSNYYKWPILNEDTPSTLFDEQYLYHINWALRKLSTLSPTVHVDFSSSLNFISACSIQNSVIFYDLRPVTLHLNNVVCKATDLSTFDPTIQPESSVSCMHVVEHIGLGRYGDRIDALGDLKAIDNLGKYVCSKGSLLFVVPIGLPAIYFNAHRVYNPRDVVRYFSNDFSLDEFYFIPANTKDPPFSTKDLSIADNFTYACGCFHFVKF